MKKDVHPKTRLVVFQDSQTAFLFLLIILSYFSVLVSGAKHHVVVMVRLALGEVGVQKYLAKFQYFEEVS